MTKETGMVLVIGGGASGMAGAYAAACGGAPVILLEKNEKLGKKLYITGKGRCNFTNMAERATFFDHLISNPRFFYSAYERFDNQAVCLFLKEHGTPWKVERGGRVFPQSDHASDVSKAWTSGLQEQCVDIRLHAEANAIETEPGGRFRVRTKEKAVFSAEAVIIATGGLSYPSTGSTGDGYRFAGHLGHTVQSCRPSLVSLEVQENWIQEVEGLSLRQICLRTTGREAKLFRQQGDLVFTSRGISGPLALAASARLGKRLESGPLVLALDCKPALTLEQVDARLQREIQTNPRKSLKNLLHSLLPSALCPIVLRLGVLDPMKSAGTLTQKERFRLRDLLKQIPLTVVRTGGYEEAVVTQGGISVKEINPKTMQSKRVPGLFFAGEVLDLDALTGGYNLQIAWSTGYAAGTAAAEYVCTKQKGKENGISDCH